MAQHIRKKRSDGLHPWWPRHKRVGAEGIWTSLFGGELQRFTEFTGQVVCVGCSLAEVKKARPHLLNLYQLNHAQDRVVIQIESFADLADRHYWQTVAGLTDKVSVWAADHIFEELTAEENLFREMTVTGILRSTRILDIGNVRVRG